MAAEIVVTFPRLESARWCGDCGRNVSDGPFRFCIRCRKINLKLRAGGLA